MKNGYLKITFTEFGLTINIALCKTLKLNSAFKAAFQMLNMYKNVPKVHIKTNVLYAWWFCNNITSMKNSIFETIFSLRFWVFTEAFQFRDIKILNIWALTTGRFINAFWYEIFPDWCFNEYNIQHIEFVTKCSGKIIKRFILDNIMLPY